MERLNVDGLRKIQLEILDVVAEFCEQNDIQYWIDSGTLLGAIRHKGYIPWDDDIDLGMLREDYDRFAQIFNEKNDRYKFLCVENTPSFYVPHGKVCDTTTVLYEPDEKGHKTSINIDIFVYDNAPDNDDEVKKMYDRRDFLRMLYNTKTNREIRSTNLLKKLVKYALRVVLRLFGPNDLILRMSKNSKKYAQKSTKRVGNFTSFTRMVCDKRVFNSYIDVEFEGKLYKAPVGYDEWLRSFYNNYMELPPVEKRVSHHSFVAYANINEKEDI